MKFTSTYPGAGIALVLLGLFVVCTLRIEHLVALGYGSIVAIAHVSRAGWHR